MSALAPGFWHSFGLPYLARQLASLIQSDVLDLDGVLAVAVLLRRHLAAIITVF